MSSRIRSAVDREVAVWFLVGALGGVLGPAGLAALAFWLTNADSLALAGVLVVVAILGSALALRRRGGYRAARAWAGVVWFGVSGFALVLAAEVAGAVLPLDRPPPAAQQAFLGIASAVFMLAWAAATGVLAVALLLVARALGRHGGPASR